MLWFTGSLFEICTFCPVITPITCGRYIQYFWSRTAGVDGVIQLPAGSPLFTQTNTFRRVLLELTTMSSAVTGWSRCVRSHCGLADMSMGLGVGFGPV